MFVTSHDFLFTYLSFQKYSALSWILFFFLRGSQGFLCHCILTVLSRFIYLNLFSFCSFSYCVVCKSVGCTVSAFLSWQHSSGFVSAKLTGDSGEEELHYCSCSALFKYEGSWEELIQTHNKILLYTESGKTPGCKSTGYHRLQFLWSLTLVQ